MIKKYRVIIKFSVQDFVVKLPDKVIELFNFNDEFYYDSKDEAEKLINQIKESSLKDTPGADSARLESYDGAELVIEPDVLLYDRGDMLIASCIVDDPLKSLIRHLKNAGIMI